jgi:hypothetical protein
MSKPGLHDLPARYQAQAIEQLHGTPKPRTVKLVHADPLPFVPHTPAKTIRKTPLALVVAFLASRGVYAPEAEFKFAADRKWRFDYAWPARRIALEVEGGVYTQGRHTRGSGFVKDMEKYNRATVLGWRVLRVTPQQLLTEQTAAMVRAMIEAAA